MISSYWKSVNVGDPKLAGFFTGSPMVLEEKLDGSQLSFGKINGVLCARSRNKQLDVDNPEKLFARAIEHIKTLDLPDNVIFRGEAITSNRHNTLVYSKMPPGFVVIFNADSPITGETLDHIKLADELGFMHATQLAHLDGNDTVEAVINTMELFLDKESALGGAKLEGVVCKRLSDPKYFMNRPIFAKLVSQEFREKHKLVWKGTNPGNADILHQIIDALATDARFIKSVQHMAERGELDRSLKDIGPLIKEVGSDCIEEEEEWIKDRLWSWAKDKVRRGIGSRVPSWYKEYLVKEFVNGENES